ncbi:MAG TPA: DNA translocase FtsK 4TM domain-containing protein [Candidatus Paceibacterota bacterium]
MAKKKQRDQEPLLAQETVESIAAVLSFLLALIFTLAWFGKAGKVGVWILVGFTFLLGKAYFLLPLVLVLAGLALLFSLKEKVLGSSFVGAFMLLLSGLGLAEILFGGRTGGLVGEFTAKPFVYFFDTLASSIIFGTLVLVSFLIIFNASLRRTWQRHEALLKEKAGVEPPVAAPSPVKEEVIAVAEALSSGVSVQQKKEEVKKDLSAELLKKLKMDPKLYALPPLSLLDSDKGKPSAGDIKANANIIQRTLQDFGIPVEIAEVNIGPSITQYAIKPAQGVKLSRIVALQNDLALALAAHPLRIEAPIPGKSFVGIEIPNRLIALVGLRSLLEEDAYQKGGPLVFALGKDVSGKPLFADLARMPHLLIAGSTGTGKSVSVHSFLMNLFFKNTPLSLRLILIDPKRVELAHYQDIPHLLAPVITESKETISALRWAVKEMEERYKTLQQGRKRDVISYNAMGGDYMPYIVIVIDELADLMAAYGREVEASIVRLAQMARAVGIHLVLSTQRPSVEVITGLIKANITSRIAFQVASQIDSRTILDAAGAEKLLGNGDMLFLAGDVSKPRRVQGAFVSEAEVKRVTEYVRDQETELEYNEDVLTAKADPSRNGGAEGDENADEFYDDAYNIVLETGKASTTFLQRRLSIGYARAARLMDMLEERGVVGPGDGAKPREVFIKKDDPNNNIYVA